MRSQTTGRRGQYGSSRVGDATTDLFNHKLRGIVDIFDGVNKNGEMNLQSSGDALFIPCPVRRFSLGRLGCGEEGQGLFPVNLHQTTLAASSGLKLTKNARYSFSIC